MPNQPRRSVRGFRLDDWIWNALCQEAAELGVTGSDVGRDAMGKHAKKYLGRKKREAK